MIWLFIKTMVLFLAVANCKRIYDQGDLTLFWKIVMAIPAVMFYLLDVAFMNWALGTVMYAELPRWREWTFSARTRRHYEAADGWRWHVAYFWRSQINIFLPGHIE